MGKHIPDFYTFDDMKARMQGFIIENDYFRYLLTCDEMMFTWGGLPENIDMYRLEDFLNLTGGVVWKEIDGKHMVAPFPARTGQIDQWGYGEQAHSSTLNGISLEGTVGKDVAIMYNNTNRTPQDDLYITADIFSAIDTASKANVKFSRIAPLFACESTKQQKALDDLLSKVFEGELKTIVSDKDININAPTSESGLKVLETLTEPEKIQYLQYLSQYFDIRMRRHFMRRGLALKTSDKQAQVTNEEVHGLDAASWFYPLSKLQARKDGAEMINRIYGTNITVEFSELWAQEWESYKLRALAEDVQEEQQTQEIQEGTENDNNDSGNSESA